MAPRLAALVPRPIGFAHRGGKAHAPENSLAAFEAALASGATGLESDARATADGSVVLHHGSRLRPSLRSPLRRPLRAARREDLPASVLAPEELYESCGAGFEFSVDVKDPRAAPGLVAAARRAGEGAAGRLWLCSPSLSVLGAWRQRWSDVRLVHSTRRRLMEHGPERLAARLARSGIDAVNMPHGDWTGGTVVLFHRFGVQAFGWDAQYDRTLGDLLDAGIDAVYSDHVDRMVSAIARYYD
ncbi:MAG: glycerophosphodiester phosphodiesterase [bacterium]|nr:glycerophosphodiester phosphodiesterase [bacterium]MCY3924810.1 glycerophosphodiester phosphodiesterase [bacterium]